MSGPLAVVRGVLSWPVGQQKSRRNAMVASTALAGLREERAETEEFLARHARHRSAAGPVRVGAPTAPEAGAGTPEVRIGVI